MGVASVNGTSGSASPEILLHAGPDEVAEALAARLMARLTEIQREFRIPQLALTGGRIATRAYERLASEGSNSAVDWTRVELWWGDERFVPADHPDRNAKQALDLLAKPLALNDDRIHEMPVLILIKPRRRTPESLAMSSSTSACSVWDQTAMSHRSSLSTRPLTPKAASSRSGRHPSRHRSGSALRCR
jgi:Glucosamine-6-phosphate isomerases/6-phosphogluconolactonase